ncbi:MAG TPA: ATP-binding protein [Burkholderiaceae bacterium]|jgi:two-component system sensor histidine kinase PilS (NtrC family)|nr:ATP-binding protein [Burkholderiaceae bacterium]
MQDATHPRAVEAPTPDDPWFNTQLPGEAGTGRWSGKGPVLRPLAGRALRRIFATYLAARVALGIALTVAIVLMGAVTGRNFAEPLALCVAYVVQSIAWGLLERWRPFDALRSARWQWWMTIGVDLCVFGAMHWLDPLSSLNFAALLVLPVLMAGILTPRPLALATTAGVALMLLGAAGRAAAIAVDPAGLMSQAGLNGMGLFVVTLLAGEVAARLALEERTARDSSERARQQAQLSRLVIEDMSEGVLVIDRQLRVRAANPSARRLLVAEVERCPAPPFGLRLHPGWTLLSDEVQKAFARGHWTNASQDVNLHLEDGTRRTLQMRARFTRGQSDGAGAASADDTLCVVFIEDLKTVQARLRQERLAAMGRISAGVAHEIRNPLAAIAQANALLEEDELRPDQRRLVRIMTDNIDRLRRIVDDVMEAAPGSFAPSRALDATTEVASVCSEWARTVGLALGSDSRLEARLPASPLGVAFDPDHLRRVLVNLLDNAVRHASPARGAVQVSLEPLQDPAWVRLAVASDGDPIAPDVEPYLFEPFHSTRSRGTGLGLYICRELCERHGARIDFRRQDGPHCNVFEVMMPRESLTSAEGRLVS